MPTAPRSLRRRGSTSAAFTRDGSSPVLSNDPTDFVGGIVGLSGSTHGAVGDKCQLHFARNRVHDLYSRAYGRITSTGLS